MKKLLFTLPFLFTFYAKANSYESFHRYIYSRPVTLANGEALKSALLERGYNFQERDWLTITLHMNGLRKEILPTLGKTIVYLPPQKTFASFVQTRKIASTHSNKKSCEPVSKNFLINKYGKDNVAYLEYIELMTSRKVEVQRGTSIAKLVENDHFSYGSEARAIKLIKEANGIRHDYVEKDGVVHLPFCADTIKNERVVASSSPQPEIRRTQETQLVIRKTVKQETPVPQEEKLNIIAGINYGAVDIKRSSTELSTSFAKVGGKLRKKLNSEYTGSIGATLAQFYNITHSDSKEKKTVSSVYPEFSGDVTRRFELWSLGLAYDSLNYFVATDNTTKVVLDPVLIHRLSLKPSFNITDHFAVFAGIGYLKSFGNEKVSGIDYTAGGSYFFGTRNDYTVSALLNRNTMDTAQSNANDESQSWVVSLSKTF